MSLVSASIAWYWRSRPTRAAISSDGPMTLQHALAERDGDVVGVERALGREQPVAALVLLADDQRLRRRCRRGSRVTCTSISERFSSTTTTMSRPRDELR